MIIEIKCTINVVCLNHPETIPSPPSVEKPFSTKPVPGAKKVGDRCPRRTCLHLGHGKEILKGSKTWF